MGRTRVWGDEEPVTRPGIGGREVLLHRRAGAERVGHAAPDSSCREPCRLRGLGAQAQMPGPRGQAWPMQTHTPRRPWPSWSAPLRLAPPRVPPSAAGVLRDLVGGSPAMQAVFAAMTRLAPACARHAGVGRNRAPASPRSRARCIGSGPQRSGAFAVARGADGWSRIDAAGTLFVRDVGDLPPEAQGRARARARPRRRRRRRARACTSIAATDRDLDSAIAGAPVSRRAVLPPDGLRIAPAAAARARRRHSRSGCGVPARDVRAAGLAAQAVHGRRHAAAAGPGVAGQSARAAQRGGAGERVVGRRRAGRAGRAQRRSALGPSAAGMAPSAGAVGAVARASTTRNISTCAPCWRPRAGTRQPRRHTWE